MKRKELIDCYYKLLHIKNYSPRTEKSYLHQLNLFLERQEVFKKFLIEELKKPEYLKKLQFILYVIALHLIFLIMAPIFVSFRNFLAINTYQPLKSILKLILFQ